MTPRFVPVKILKTLLTFSHREKTRYAMHGVYVCPSGDLVATDGKALAVVQTGHPFGDEEGFTLCAKGLKAAIKTAGPKGVLIDRTLPLIAGVFPPHAEVVKAGLALRSYSVQALPKALDPFLRAVEKIGDATRVSFADGTGRGVLVTRYEGAEVTMNLGPAVLGAEAGNLAEVGLSASFFRKVLAASALGLRGGASVELAFPQDPKCMITCTRDLGRDGTLVLLLMPLNLG